MGYINYLKLFQDYLKKNRKSPATILAYTADLNLFLMMYPLNDGQLANFTKENVSNFLKKQERKFSAKTLSRRLNSLRSFGSFLAKSRLIGENPAGQIAYPKHDNVAPNPPKTLSLLEQRALHDVIRNDQRLKAMIFLMVDHGLRISEVANLKIADFQKKYLQVRPLDKYLKRRILLRRETISSLKKYLGKRPKSKFKNIFLTKTARPILIRNLRSQIQNRFKKAGISATSPNSLRFTFVKNCREKGMKEEEILSLCGYRRN